MPNAIGQECESATAALHRSIIHLSLLSMNAVGTPTTLAGPATFSNKHDSIIAERELFEVMAALQDSWAD